MESELKIGQLTKELVAMNLKEVQNPSAVAAGVVRQTIVVALKSGPSGAQSIVSDACYGGMQGLLLSDQDLACGALMILSAVTGGAADIPLSPDDMRRYAIEGLARIAKFVTGEDLTAIGRVLERRQQGAGQAFSDAVAAHRSAALAAAR
jgi:hypothetical protein